MKNNSRFERGSGCFKCAVCKRTTRNVGDNGSVGLCPQCYEVAGIENQIADGSYYDGQTEESCIAEIAKLNAEVIAKGGTL